MNEFETPMLSQESNNDIASLLNELKIAVIKSYVCHKEVLTEEEAMTYLDVSRSYWDQLVRDKKFPVYSMSRNKKYVKRKDIEYYACRTEYMIMSDAQIKAEARRIARSAK